MNDQQKPNKEQIDPVLQVCEQLQSMGVPASYEYPGYISIVDRYERAWAFGTANPQWAGHQVDASGEALEAGAIDLPFDSHERHATAAIAQAIAAHIDKSPSKWRVWLTLERITPDGDNIRNEDREPLADFDTLEAAAEYFRQLKSKGDELA